MNVLVGAWTVLKYVSIGCLIWMLGGLFYGPGAEFRNRSEPAQLIVLEVQSKRISEGRTSYRPVLALADAKPPRQEYTGTIWTRPKPHEPGDIVPGRFDPETGEMRSAKMLGKTVWIGRIAQIFGILIGLQAIAIIMGVPEDRLPLRVRIRSRQRRGIRLGF